MSSAETSQEVESMAGITRYCFLEDDLGQFPLPVIKAGQMGGQGSSRSINRDALQLHLRFWVVCGWINGGRKSKLTDKGTS